MTKVPRMVEEAFEYIEDVATTVTDRVKTLVNTSATATAWAMAGMRGEIERVARQLAGADDATTLALFPALGLVQQVIIPSSALRTITVDILQGMTRNIGSAGVTVAGTLNGETLDPITIADFPAIVQPIAAAILGTAQVGSIEQRIAEAELFLRDWGNRMRTNGGSSSVRTIGALVGDHAPLFAVPAILASVGMDLTPFGGLESGATKAIVRATTRIEAIAVLRRLGVGEHLATAFADDAVRATTDGAATTLLRRLAGEMDAARNLETSVMRARAALQAHAVVRTLATGDAVTADAVRTLLRTSEDAGGHAAARHVALDAATLEGRAAEWLEEGARKATGLTGQTRKEIFDVLPAASAFPDEEAAVRALTTALGSPEGKGWIRRVVEASEKGINFQRAELDTFIFDTGFPVGGGYRINAATEALEAVASTTKVEIRVIADASGNVRLNTTFPYIRP